MQSKAQDGGAQMPKSGPPTGKRQTVSPNGSRRYVRRDASGRFTEDQVKTGRSIARDRRTDAKNTAPKGMKDRGD
jgi:hypothetical protein